MGLDCVVKIYNHHDGTYDSKIPQNIAEKFKLISDSKIIGMSEINLSSEYAYIGFRGKAYSWAVTNITNKKYNLYRDLGPNELKEIYLDFEKFLSNARVLDDNEINRIQNAFEKTMIMDKWIGYFIDEYIPSPKEIKGLKEFFRICYENNLTLYASY